MLTIDDILNAGRAGGEQSPKSPVFPTSPDPLAE
jgi:hypothetical protein